MTLARTIFKRFRSLVGLEIKGYTTSEDTTTLSGDSFSDLGSVTYLSLESVILGHQSVENNVEDRFSNLVRINYTFNDVATNEITSQVLILNDNESGKEFLPEYFEYKEVIERERRQAPLNPKFRVAFTGMGNLQHLKISGCNLHDISWDMFHRLENLKYLLLDENDLLFLPDFVFYATSNLSALSLSNNKILNLQTVGLAGLLFLQKLDVSNNNITHLSELSLPPFPHLEVADFRNNPISSIFPNTFEIMNSTRTLYLGSPTTSLDLSPNSFYGLVSLLKLDITNVKIRLLEKAQLRGMPQLTTLIMTGKISRIAFDAFGEVTQLEKIILKNCGIKKISMDALFGLTALQELDLSHNLLAFLPPGLFEDQISLKEVYLNHNRLTTLPALIIQNLPVRILRLEANPWHCSCDMKNWSPQITNRVKRYTISPVNSTLCQKSYDKGSMCFEEPRKFEPTYSYDNRVAPVCETPLKFNKRSVHQVMRRELRYCKIPKKVPVPLSASNETGTEANLFSDNYSSNTLKQLEKQLMAKPVKPKKPVRVNTENNRPVIEETTTSVHRDDDQTLNNLITNFLPQRSNSSMTNDTLFPSFTLNSTGDLIIQEGNPALGHIPSPEESSWLPTTVVKPRPKEKKKNKKKSRVSPGAEVPHTIATNNYNQDTNAVPKVSSKSLKLNRPRRG